MIFCIAFRSTEAFSPRLLVFKFSIFSTSPFLGLSGQIAPRQRLQIPDHLFSG